MPLWNKRAVSSGQTEETYKEQLQSLKQTVNNLGLVSEQFEGAAEGLTESSDKVGHGVQVLAEGASRQERDVLQCRKIAEEFTAKITDMDQETATMQTQVQQMQQQSDLGRQRVEHLGKTQEKLKGSMDTITEEIRTLLDKNAKIESVTSVLFSIAKQTNLLSLNASIEAARAGEAGKGFAVVADQIRTLSTETHASSEQIRNALSRLDATSAKMTSSIEETLKLIQITLEKVTQTGDNVNQIASDSVQLGNHIQVVDNAIKEVESSNTQLVSNMEQVSNIVDTITTCITHSSRTSERMLSKYQETADNINTIEDVMENMMCDLGIGGFMGIEDVKPGMKIDLQLVDQKDDNYLGELIEQIPEGLLVSCQKKLTINGSASCMLQVTAGNILYCWDKATISPAPENGEHAFKITITTRPRINNRRKYPRMDLNNTCTIKFKNSDTEYAATMENISANGFAFLATDKIFTQSKNAEVIITIHDFALSNHNVLEGRIIRCSDDNGLYIVGCQMPEDNFYILEYVENNLNK